MMSKSLAFAAAAGLAATPCLSAELPNIQENGARRSGAVAGLYFSVPFTGTRSKAPRAGLRLSMTHDYRHAGAQTARVLQSDTLDLRLIGERKTTLFVAGKPVTGKEAKRQNLGPVNTAVTVAVLVAAAVGVYFIHRAIDDSGEE